MFVLISLGVVVILSLTAFFLLPKSQTVKVASKAVLETKELFPERGPSPCPKESQRPLTSGEKLYCR